MKTIAALFGLIATLFLAAPAAATPAGPTFETCTNLKGWYVNPDETDRKPTPTVGGLEFAGDDLIHHAAGGTVADLAKGTFVASPAPDQPSFFSVEVRNADGTGYATLRWDTTRNKWVMVTGGQVYENASPAGLVAMTTPAKSSTLMSFGVGYTKNPPGTVTTVVKSVTFAGKTYDLTCAPAASASSSASASSTASAAPSTSTEATAASLPVTGAPTGLLLAIGGLVTAAGAGLFLTARRRRTRFTA